MRSQTDYTRAACLVEDPELFFPYGRLNGLGFATQVAVARSVCAECPVQAGCLRDNLDVRDGIFAGTLPHQREDLRRRLGIPAMPLLDLPQDKLARSVAAQRARLRQIAAENVTPDQEVSA